MQCSHCAHPKSIGYGTSRGVQRYRCQGRCSNHSNRSRIGILTVHHKANDSWLDLFDPFHGGFQAKSLSITIKDDYLKTLCKTGLSEQQHQVVRSMVE